MLKGRAPEKEGGGGEGQEESWRQKGPDQEGTVCQGVQTVSEVMEER